MTAEQMLRPMQVKVTAKLIKATAPQLKMTLRTLQTTMLVMARHLQRYVLAPMQIQFQRRTDSLIPLKMTQTFLKKNAWKESEHGRQVCRRWLASGKLHCKAEALKNQRNPELDSRSFLPHPIGESWHKWKLSQYENRHHTVSGRARNVLECRDNNLNTRDFIVVPLYVILPRRNETIAGAS